MFLLRFNLTSFSSLLYCVCFEKENEEIFVMKCLSITDFIGFTHDGWMDAGRGKEGMLIPVPEAFRAFSTKTKFIKVIEMSIILTLPLHQIGSSINDVTPSER